MEKIKEFLLTNHVKVPDDWLEQCCEHVQSESGTLPFNELAENVYQLWLTADLTELEFPVLPNCLTKANRFFLNGYYCVQVNSVFDSSVSSYSQLQRITNTENENAEVTGEEETKKPWEQQKAKRMLVLELSDGVTNVRGMEYQTIPTLSVDLPPGRKILLTGRIECRKGMLMLSAENVVVLGGYVERLADENSQKNLLSRRVNSFRSDSNRPNRDLPSRVINEREVDNLQTGFNAPQNPPRNDRTINSFHQHEQREGIGNEGALLFTNGDRRKPLKVKDDDDVVLLSDDEDVVLLQAVDELTRNNNFESPQKLSSRSSPMPQTKQKLDPGASTSAYFYQPPAKKERSEEGFEDFPIEDEWHFDEDAELSVDDQVQTVFSTLGDNVEDAHSSFGLSPLARVVGKFSSTSGAFKLDVLHEPMKGIDLNFHRNISRTDQPKPTFRLTRLCDLLPKDGSQMVNSRVCTVKAAIIHTISHLNPNNGERWSYSAKFTDGTAVVDCQISDEVLTQLIEMTAAEALAIRNSSIETAKLKAMELVKKAANFVQSFNGLMQIETKFQNLAIVRKMKPLDDSEIKILENIFLSRS